MLFIFHHQSYLCQYSGSQVMGEQFHIKSSRTWHLYLSEFLHFCTICRYHWNMKIQLITPSGSWDIAICEIWAKYLIGTKICHFELTLSLITSGLKDLSSWNLVRVSFLAPEVQESHLEYTKTNQCSVISHFKFSLCLNKSGTGKVCGTTIIQKKIFLQKLKTLI